MLGKTKHKMPSIPTNFTLPGIASRSRVVETKKKALTSTNIKIYITYQRYLTCARRSSRLLTYDGIILDVLKKQSRISTNLAISLPVWFANNELFHTYQISTNEQ